MAEAIDTVLFDLGRVVVDFDTDRLVSRLTAHSPAEPAEIKALLSTAPLYHDLECGRITPRDYHAELCRLLSLSLSYDAFVPLWNDIFTAKPEMEELVRAVKGRCRIAALSNTNELHWNYLYENFDIMKSFDDYFLSYRLGCRKPEPAIYRAALDGCNVPGERLLYIDDVPAFVNAATAQGIRGVVFTTPEALRNVLP